MEIIEFVNIDGLTLDEISDLIAKMPKEPIEPVYMPYVVD